MLTFQMQVSASMTSPVSSLDVPFSPGEIAVVVAHLTEDGVPRASKFLLDYSPAPDAQSRVTLHHVAAAPQVDPQAIS